MPVMDLYLSKRYRGGFLYLITVSSGIEVLETNR